jgi:hypothetical protein
VGALVEMVFAWAQISTESVRAEGIGKGAG